MDTLRDMEGQFRRIAETAQSPQIRKDADRAAVELAKFFDDIRTEAEKAAAEQAAVQIKQAEQAAARSFQLQMQARVKAAREAAKQTQAEADAAAKAYAKTFAGRVPLMMREAVKAFPVTLQIDADASRAEREVFELTQRMRALADTEIGVDIDAAEAQRELASIRRQLQLLARTSTDVQIRTNALGALSEIDAVEAGARRSQRELIGLSEAASFAQSRLTLMINAGAAIAPIIAPAAATAAAAIGFIGTAAGSVAAGIGVFALGLSGVGDAVKALNAQQLDAAKTAKSLGAAQNAVANATDGLMAAERGVGEARQAAGEAAANAARRVEDAERNVAKARRESRRAVEDSMRALAEARREAADAVEDAVEAAADAQRGLTRAEADALEVRRDLNEAIREAKRDIEDLALAIQKNALDQREATTEIMEEREKLNKLLANPRATEIEKRNAQEAYDARVLQLKQLQVEGKRLSQEQQEYSKKGVEANDKVIAARERIRDADERVADQQRALAKSQERLAEVQVQSSERVAEAQRNVSRAQEQGAERVADAERNAADARRAQAVQQRQSARQIADAQQALIRAQRAQQQAVAAQAVAGSEAMDKLKESMDALSPAGQRFARFLFGLKDEMKSLRDSAQEGLLPGLQQGIEELLPYLPGLNAFVHEMGEALGEMFVNLVRSLDNPTWQRFFGFFRTNAVPTLQLLFEAGMNVSEGFAELFLALTPFNAEIGTGLLDLTEGFAKWARELSTSTGYQEFLAYVRDVGPDVVNLLLQMGEFAGRLIVALAPAGELLVSVFGGLFEFLNGINPTVLTVIASGIALIGASILAMGLATKAILGLRSLFTNLSLARTTVMDAFRRSTDQTRQSIDRLGQTRFGGPLVAGMRGAQTAVGDFSRSVTLTRGPMQQMEGDMVRMNRALDGGGGRGAGLIDGLGRAGAALAVMQTAGLILPNASGQAQNVNALTKELQEFARTGKVGSEAAKLLGDDLKLLEFDLKTLDTGMATDWGNGVARFTETITGLGGAFDESLENAQKRLSSMDSALTDLVNSGNGDAAAAIFSRLAAEGAKQGISLNELNKALPSYNNALGEAADAAAKAADNTATAVVEMDEATAAANRHHAITQSLNATTGLSISARAQLSTQYDQNAAKIAALSTLVDQFNTAEGTAAGRADALREVIKLQTNEFVTANEAEESFRAGLDTLSTTINTNAAALIGHKDKLDINTAAGRSNRDALQQVASSIRDVYLQDIASGVPMDAATRKHQERIKELREEAKRLGLTTTETRDLIDAYGDVPQEIITEFSTGKSFEQAYLNLRELNFMQQMIAQGITDPAEVKRRWRQQTEALYQRPPTTRATGGPIHGPGTKTSDSVLIRASDGEYMQQAAAVDYYGMSFMDMINRRKIPKDTLPGFAEGGFIQAAGASQPKRLNQVRTTNQVESATAPFTIGLSDVWKPTAAEARNIALDEMGGVDLGDLKGGKGYKWQVAVLRQAFPGMDVLSTFRKNSRTLSGNLSWHARGRAVDVEPTRKIAQWIKANYGKRTLELITPWRDMMLHRGKPHRFSRAVERQHGVGNAGNDHIHWAYDEGGWLPPGLTSVMNNTGKPEAVFTSEQFRDIRALVEGRSGQSLGQQVYNFEFANSTLTPDRLRSIQARQDALARVGRRNY
jgi:hypothetical protein